MDALMELWKGNWVVGWRNDMISGAHTQTSSRTIIIMERVRKRSVCGRPPDFLVLGELWLFFLSWPRLASPPLSSTFSRFLFRLFYPTPPKRDRERGFCYGYHVFLLTLCILFYFKFSYVMDARRTDCRSDEKRQAERTRAPESYIFCFYGGK